MLVGDSSIELEDALYDLLLLRIPLQVDVLHQLRHRFLVDLAAPYLVNDVVSLAEEVSRGQRPQLRLLLFLYFGEGRATS